MKLVGGVDFFFFFIIIVNCLIIFFLGYLCIYFYLSIYFVLFFDIFLCISMVLIIVGVFGKVKDVCKFGIGDDVFIGVKGGV